MYVDEMFAVVSTLYHNNIYNNSSTEQKSRYRAWYFIRKEHKYTNANTHTHTHTQILRNIESNNTHKHKIESIESIALQREKQKRKENK